MTDFHDWNIEDDGLVARHIQVRTTFLRFFERPLRVAHGTRALLFEDGAFRGEIGEGRHDHGSLALLLGRGVPRGAFDVVIVQAGDLLVDHAYQRVESADGYPLDVRLQLRLVIRDPSAFFFHFVQQRKRVALPDVVEFLERRVESASRVAVKRFGIEHLREAHGGRDLRLALESELERETHDELLRIGLDLVHLATFEASNRRVEALQDRRVELVFRREELKQEQAERVFDKDERGWREGERRGDRDFEHDRERWDADKDVEEAKDRVQGWASMADVVRQRSVLKQGDLLELIAQLDRQSLDYRKARDLRTHEGARFDGDLDVARARLKTDWDRLKQEIDLEGFRGAMSDAEARGDLEQARIIGERARKAVLDKLEISQWAELTGHQAMKEAEVEALTIRIEMERVGQKAGLAELGMKTEQRLNDLFLQGKARELGLQEAVAEAARRASILALKHDISTEEMGLALDEAQGARGAAELRRALQQKVAVAEFNRAQALEEARAGAGVRALKLASEVEDELARQELAKGQIEVGRYDKDLEAKAHAERERVRIELEKLEDENDLETLGRLARIKLEKEKGALELDLKRLDAEHARRVQSQKNAAEQVLAEKELALRGQELHGKLSIEQIRAEAERDGVLKGMSADQMAIRLDTAAASVHFDTQARVAEAQAKHSAEHEKDKYQGILGARDQFDAERQAREETDRRERAAQAAAARDERESERSHLRDLLGTAIGSRGAHESETRRHSDELRQAERGSRDEVREAYREGLAHTSAVAGASSPRMAASPRAAAPARSGGPSVTLNVDMGSQACGRCGVVNGNAGECENCGAALR